MKRRIIIIGILVGILLAVKLDILTFAQSQGTKIEIPLSSEGPSLEDAVINVANTTGKAVVSISTEHTTKIPGGKRLYFNRPFGRQGLPFGEDDPFRKFFDDFLGDLPDREFKQNGLGSGVIINPEGYVLTNEHVINEADKITVTLPDGREFKGEVKGHDSRSDLAVIKIDARNLPVAVLGDSDSLKIGQWVVAIGNPFGFALDNPEPTVTTGVVSALHRSLGRSIARYRDYSDLIQTDTAINPGNSGGPLVNLRGEVVGINVAIFSTSGGYQGIGFAIPVNNAKRIISKLIEGKKILYGWLGVTVQDLTDDLAGYFALSAKNGVLVVDVLEGGPAEEAGIKESDIIKEFDRKPINTVKDLLSIVAKTDVGRKVKLLVVRDKKEMTVEIEIGERPENPEEEKVEAVSSSGWRGLEVEELNSESVQRFNLKGKKGVLIVKVEPDSPADKAGVNTADLITKINKEPVNNLADYQKITKGLTGNALVRTLRGYYVIKPGE